VELSGALLFARYAYPPNQLGYCGPDDHRALLEYGASGTHDGGLDQLARGFDGAWPYLRLIAEATGIGNPLDHRVVEAYWVGNPLLDRIDRLTFGNALTDRFRPRTGTLFSSLAENIPAGAVPHHSFHVFGVYPWAGLLRGPRSEHPLQVLQSCRIRWGRVQSVTANRAVVTSQPLAWDGRQLTLGAPSDETVTHSLDGLAFTRALNTGDWVSMHWGWVCDVLNPRQLAALRRYTAHQLAITNTVVEHSGPAAVLA
jgi:hypothetical protein